MNATYRAAAAAGLVILMTSLMPSMAHAAKLKKHNRLEGAVTAVSSTANTITVHNKKLDTDTTIMVSSATTYTKSTAVPLSSLSIGDKIAVHSKADFTAGDATITATRIEEVSPLAEPKKHAGAKSVEGTIASLTPSLTITTDDGSTVIVTTDATTHVFASEPASFSDVAIGQHIQAQGQLTGTSFTADAVNISPSHKGNGKKNKADI